MRFPGGPTGKNDVQRPDRVHRVTEYAVAVAFVALTACTGSHGSSDGGSEAGVSGVGTCADEMTELSAAAHRYSGPTPLPCGPSFGHCSECFYDYDCMMGFVYIRVNGVQCDTGPRPIDAGPDVR